LSATLESTTTHGGEGEEISFTAAALAQHVGGLVDGDGDVVVRRVAPIDRACEDDLSFLGSSKFVSLAAGSRAGAVFVTAALKQAARSARARIIVAEPYEAMLRALPLLYPARPVVAEIHPTGTIGRGASIGRSVAIGPHAVIGADAILGDGASVGAHAVVGEGVRVGAGSWIGPAVTLYPGTTLGERVRIHAGSRLGCDGFGYVFAEGVHGKIPHVGRCVVGDDVEIGANCTIDRGSIDDTVIGAGTKIDNLVHIAHNVRIGRLCLLMAQVGIAGSVRLGDGCVLAGQVGVSGHHVIGDGVRLAAQAGVFGDIPAGETWSGYPARPHQESLRAHAALFRLAGMIRRLERLLTQHER